MVRRFDTVSFLSDLGVGSDTVGVVRAIVRDLAPHAVVVDLTHAVAPYDVRGGSLSLARAIGYVPSGVVVASVDPASDRPHVAVEVAGGEGVLVGPDNGVLAPAVAIAGGAERAVVLSDPALHLPSPGGLLAVRDIYAPVAAHLCNGIDLAELGEVVAVEALLPGVVPLPRTGDDGSVVAEVLWVNHLGDCQLNVGADDLGLGDGAGRGVRLEVVAGTGRDPMTRVAEWLGAGSVTVVTGAIGAAVDPYGMVALVASRRSAAEELRIGTGDQVVVRVLRDGGTAAGAQGTTSPVTLRSPRRD
ncbi:MAG: SAM hydrolase/SAM-dependent halogenase family protein [Ilumatobacteraceae bacterium]